MVFLSSALISIIDTARFSWALTLVPLFGSFVPLFTNFCWVGLLYCYVIDYSFALVMTFHRRLMDYHTAQLTLSNLASMIRPLHRLL